MPIPMVMLFLLLCASCRPEAGKPAAPRPIFRHYNTELSTIHLGQPWTAEEIPGADPGDTVVALTAGPYERAQAVRVHRTLEGVVSSIMFDYPQQADFATMEREYTDLLGPPRRRDAPRTAEAAERIVWQDSITTFELVRDPKRSASTIYTRLLDRSTSK